MTDTKSERSSEEKEEKPEHAESEPMEEAAPQDCNAISPETGFKVGDLEGPPQDAEFKAHEEIAEAFPLEEIPLVFMPDGMPSPVDPEGALPLAHPFSIESVVCIEDTRTYVELYQDEIREILRARIDIPQEIRVAPHTNVSRYDTQGRENKRREFEDSKVYHRYGLSMVVEKVPLGSSSIPCVFVRPIRERCKFYKRQVFALDGTKLGDDGHFLVFRNCTMRRSVGGAFLSLRDEAVYACDYRDPPDMRSVKKYLDDKDNAKLKNRPDLTLVPMFGGEGEDVRLEENK